MTIFFYKIACVSDIIRIFADRIQTTLPTFIRPQQAARSRRDWLKKKTLYIIYITNQNNKSMANKHLHAFVCTLIALLGGGNFTHAN